MSTVADAYVHEAYHSGKNEPEWVTEEYLTCRLCEGGFKFKPKMLACGHTFCQPCLQCYSCNGRQRAICCPTCARPTAMPDKGVSGLHTNLYIDTQLDRLLRRDNNANPRENSMYNIEEYTVDPHTRRAHLDVPRR